MGLFHQVKRLYALLKRNPEESYHVIINDGFVQVNHPWWGSKQIKWSELQEVLLINTDKGPWFPDVWLTLVSAKSSCKIPQGAEGYNAVYEIVSTFEGFDFENVIESMSCTSNAQFLLWSKTPNTKRNSCA